MFALVAAAVLIQLDAGAFRVTGWRTEPADPASAFQVSVDAPGAPPMLGEYLRENATIVFRPRFPLQPGVRYRAVWLPEHVENKFEIPKVAAPAPVVEHVYPTASRLPENLLRFYIQFSQPMSRVEAWQRIHLLDGDGRPVELPFLEIDEELWDRAGRRLTVLFDPGRIKRGLVPHNEVGVALHEGRKYTLVIDRGWPSADGIVLSHEHRKQFIVGPADREAIDPKRWRLALPGAGTRDPLVAHFGEPFDHALARRLIEPPVNGEVSLCPDETCWRFVPGEPWRPGDYTLRVGTALEDLAGNKVGRVFDVDVFERVARRIRSESIEVKFRVSPSRQ